LDFAGPTTKFHVVSTKFALLSKKMRPARKIYEFSHLRSHLNMVGGVVRRSRACSLKKGIMTGESAPPARCGRGEGVGWRGSPEPALAGVRLILVTRRTSNRSETLTEIGLNWTELEWMGVNRTKKIKKPEKRVIHETRLQ